MVELRTQCGEVDFQAALTLWGGVAPYCDFPAKTISWRLVPAYENGRLLTAVRGPRYVGFATWGWMTSEEFKSRVYCGREVFSRGAGDCLVIVDCIIVGGSGNVRAVSRAFRGFFGGMFPDQPHVYAHRGPRDGWFFNGRGTSC
jgi:hemolysin-activating ACP:hemolysin acyltransferase